MYRDDWRSLGRILAVRLDNIGDVIMLGPALRALRSAAPNANITLMTSRAGAQAASLLPWVDEVLVHRAVWQELGEAGDPDPDEQYLLAEALAEHGFDAAFIFTSFGQSPYPPAYVAYLAGIPVRVAQSHEWGGQILTHLVQPLPDETHQVDRNLHLLEAVGIRADSRRLEVRLPASARRDATRLLERAGVDATAGYVAVAPGATCEARRYPLPRMTEALSQLQERSGLGVVIIGNATEAEQCEQMALRIDNACSLAGHTSVATVASLIRGAELLVCNDSGPMHLADAVGTPLVVTFSGTELRSQFAPRSAPAVLLGEMTSCTPCHRFTCDDHLRCLDVQPEEVALAGLSLLHHESRIPLREMLKEAVHA